MLTLKISTGSKFQIDQLVISFSQIFSNERAWIIAYCYKAYCRTSPPPNALVVT